MYCPNCGKEVKDESKFCKYCGAKIEEEAFGKTNRETKSKKKGNEYG